MRSRWRAPLIAMVLASVATTPGLSQEDEESFEEESFGGDEEGEAATPSEPTAEPSESAAPPAQAAPESYVVQPGDTLWDLSERFLNNPWYWPKIWSYNPSLTNPNWIQPGTRIRFYPGATEEPVEVEPEEPTDDMEEDFVDVPLFEDKGVDAPRIADVNSDTGRREYFITDEQLEKAGQIRNSPEEKEMLSVFDAAYFDLEDKPEPGQLLQVFEVARDLRHPVTGENLGKVVHTTGIARVDRVSDEQHLGTLVASWDVISRGSYIGALQDVDIQSVRPVPNEKDLKGYVVDTARFPIRYIGQNHVVFIDRGQNDGVQVGNTFVVVRSGDPFTGELRGMQDEDIGRILVVDVGERGSTGVMLETSREVVAGDRIEMRAGE